MTRSLLVHPNRGVIDCISDTLLPPQPASPHFSPMGAIVLSSTASSSPITEFLKEKEEKVAASACLWPSEAAPSGQCERRGQEAWLLS